MKVKSSIKTIEHLAFGSHNFSINNRPDNATVNFVIDNLAGTGAITSSSKTISGRLHPSLPFVSLASPAAGTNPNYNNVLLMSEYQVDILSFSGVGTNHIQRVYLY